MVSGSFLDRIAAGKEGHKNSVGRQNIVYERMALCRAKVNAMISFLNGFSFFVVLHGKSARTYVLILHNGIIIILHPVSSFLGRGCHESKVFFVDCRWPRPCVLAVFISCSGTPPGKSEVEMWDGLPTRSETEGSVGDRAVRVFAIGTNGGGQSDAYWIWD